ncbi:MAG: M20 family metallopeptidase [Gemmatimonadota bacterium]|jgi:amidohydrolase
MKLKLLDHARDLSADLVALRRDLHRHPELSFEETRTAAICARSMAELGLVVRTGVGLTGVVADLQNGDGPTVALRADMDALPIQEVGDHGYLSTVEGVMHACGHDAHTAGLVGAARLLVAARERGELPPGTVRLLFQPSEEKADAEGKSGATRMIEDGAMEGVDFVTGLHVGAHLPAGKLFVSEGEVMAGSEEIGVEVQGESAHAARPNEGVDALTLAAQGIVTIQQAVSRRIDPMESGVVTLGTIQGGRAPNVLADLVRIEGTLRYFRAEVRDALIAAVRASFEMLERHGARVEVRIGPGYVPVVNHPDVSTTLERAFVELVGEDAVLPMEPMMGAEDFAFLAREAPGCFYWLGAACPEPREHHHSRFDIDESVLPLGAASLAIAAVSLLERG